MLRNLGMANLLMAFTVVTLGALTRLLDAGLGCPDWPGCYGFIIPPGTEANINIASQLYPETPVEAGKAWMEMIHRYFASALGLMIFFQCYLTFKHQLPKLEKRLMVFLSVWVVIQGLFGMWTVTMKVWPQVVTAHLLGGFITVIGLFFFWIRTSNLKTVELSRFSFTSLKVLTFLFVIQVALGGWTSTTYSGLACPDFPTCAGKLVPELSLSSAFAMESYSGETYLGGVKSQKDRVTIQYVHRIMALVLTMLSLAFMVRLIKEGQSRIAIALGVLLGAQVLLGILNAVLLLPLTLALLHNTGALLLVGWCSYVWALARVTKQEVGYEPKYS